MNSTFPKLPKGNLVFVSDPKILEFIEYCKEHYSDKIENIKLSLHEEHKDWQITVDCGTTGAAWVPWFIPTSNDVIVVGNITPSNTLDATKYHKIVNKKFYSTLSEEFKLNEESADETQNNELESTK